MTAPPASPTDVRAEPDEEDALLDELRERLPQLAGQVLDDPVADRLQLVPEPERPDLREAVVAHVVASGDFVLQETNPQIAVLRSAREKLAGFESPRERATPLPSPDDRGGHAVLGFVLWLGMLFPLLFWQLGRLPVTGGGWVGVVFALLVGFALTIVLARRLVAGIGVRFGGRPAVGGGRWPFVSGLATTYALLLWRLWSSSREAMGTFLAVVLWVVAGCVAFFLALMFYLPDSNSAQDEQLPRAAGQRSLFGAFLAAGAAFAVMTVPLPLPEWAVFVVADLLALLVLLLTGPAILTPGLLPAALSPDPDRRGSPKWTQQVKVLRENVATAEDEWDAVALETVGQQVTLRLNELVHPSFSTTLGVLDPRALGQMRAGDRVVTSLVSGDRLKALMAGIGGGAVGMAGPRGAGKSTLLEAYQAGRLSTPGRAHIAVLESVPVRYDAREFVLHLYARTCAAVIEFCDERRATADARPGRWAERRARWRRQWPFAAVLVVSVAAGVLGSLAARGARFDPAAWFATIWWPLVCLLGAAGLLTVASRRRPAVVPTRIVPAPPVPPGDLQALRARAEWALGDIEFQQKHTSGWSGKVGVPAGADIGVTRTHEVTRQPRSYPQIVHGFGEFLRATIRGVTPLDGIATPSVVIILDELDKIVAPDAAQDFVNEVKALFNLDVPGFLFLVSVSEDALAAFERRGLPVRDAFDSAFDVIFRVEYLKLGDARQVLSRRVLGLPDPFVCLCHCLSGGLPRELIRVARQVISGSGPLADVARRVVADDLADKRAGLRTIVARGGYDDLVGDLVRHVDAHAAADPAALVEAAATPPVTGDDEPLRRLQVETLGYLYYLGTVLEVFGPAFDRADLDRGDTTGDGSFDALASVRQLFPVNARLAWLTISAFRTVWDLRVIPPPEP